MSHEPVEIVIDLPTPTSTNKLWGCSRGRVYKTKEYVNWQKEAYYLAKSEGRWPTTRITGPFQIRLCLAESGRGDGDNRVKAALDLLQLFGVIRNDSDCRKGEWEWVPTVEAPLGCRVHLKSISSVANS